MILQDLYVLHNYYGETQSIMYEEDLVQKYGADDVRAAIDKGLIDHGWIPCGKGRRRCVCRLSQQGIDYIEQPESPKN